MGNLFTKDSQDPIAKALNEKRTALQKQAEEAKLPALVPYEVNPAIAKMSTGFVGGGPSPSEIYKGIRLKRPHSPGFVCKCRVSGVEKEWKWLSDKECSRWAENGDLLLTHAERIIREQNIQAENGRDKLQAVYRHLDMLEKQAAS